MKSTVAGERAAETSPQPLARMTGVLYLLNILTILIAILLFRGLTVSHDPAGTVSRILAHESRFRLAFAFELISTASSIAVAALLYGLLEPVNRSVSLLAAFFRLTACGIAALGYLFQLAPLQILGTAQGSSVLKLGQLQEFAFALYDLRTPSSQISIVFFGFHFVLIGYLIVRSRFLPRVLGILVALAGCGGLTFLAPPLGTSLFPYFAATGLLGEGSLTVWLLVFGVAVEGWKQQRSQ